MVDIRALGPDNRYKYSPPDDIGKASVLHAYAVGVYCLLTKYECADLQVKCQRVLINCIRLCHDQGWTDSDFIREHYHEIAGFHGGDYPEHLYHVLGEAWCIFASRRPCAELDAVIESNHSLLVAVTKSYRAKLIGVMKSMAA